jgi:2-keto-3-deoxy-L-rhamnonate aldolase RhmA
LLAIALLSGAAAAQGQAQPQGAPKPKLYNTAKQKLLEGKQIFSFTQSRFDVEGYCESAKHYDYAWIDMQHSTLNFSDVEKMLGACPGAAAIPFIRVPEAQEWLIQHATDVGALGIIVPTVDTADQARVAARYARYPPVGRRSSGAGFYSTLWGSDYRQTVNDNMVVVVMIETPVGVANAYDIASVPGVDVVIIGNNDLTQFSGYPATDPHYLEMVTKVHDETRRAGKIFGQANAAFATGHPLSKTSLFFQNGPSNDGWQPPARGGRGGGRGGPGGQPGRGPQ